MEPHLAHPFFSPFPPCDIWFSLSVSPQFISDSKALAGPKITCLGLYHRKGLQILHFLPTFLAIAVKQLALKAVMRFYFICLYLPLHQSANSLLLLLAQNCSLWAVSVHSCGANRGWPAIKSNPNETFAFVVSWGSLGCLNQHFRVCTSQNPASLAELLWVRVRSDGTKSKPGHPLEAHDCVQGHPREVGKALPPL